MKALRYIGLGLAALLLLAALVLVWLLNSTTGAKWAARRAESALAGRLAVGGVGGSLAGPLVLTDVRYADPETGLEVRIARASVDVALRALLGMRVRIEDVSARGVRVQLGESAEEKPEEPQEPFSLEPPIDMILDGAAIEDAQILSADGSGPILVVNRAELAGSWTSAALAVRHFRLESPQGRAQFAGEVTGREVYVGSANGEFDWRQGESRYAGTLALRTEGRQAQVDVQLTAPMQARLTGTLEQTDTLPWSFELDVPRFDPRRELAPESDIAVLAASLKGSGSRNSATATGRLTVGEHVIDIEPLRASWTAERLVVEELVARLDESAGRLRASGTAQLDAQPLAADLLVQWDDLELPEEWAGQRLATRGVLSITGSAERYTVKGELAAGPPGDLSDIVLAVNGTPDALQIDRFTIAQKLGRLTASGRVELTPAVSWDLTAQATRFDPGRLLPDWPGRLGFSLVSRGRLVEEGPEVTLRIERLQGTLRDRPVAGEADLSVTPNRVVAGKLHLRSGGSEVRVDGKSGEEMNLAVNLAIAALDDWLPDSAGSLRGRFDVSGRWPRITVKGNALASGLRYGEHQARRARLSIDATVPEEPAGTLALRVNDVEAAGMSLRTLRLQASGSESEHLVELDADGTPLATSLRVQGARVEGGWRGTLERLQLAAEKVPAVALVQPAGIAFVDGAISLGQSCLRGDGIGLCVAAEGRPEGPLQASYELDDLPLALVAAFAPDLPFELEGTIAGQGSVRREADGALFGQLFIASPAGGVANAEDDAEELLRYENLRIDALLQGDVARLQARGVVGAGGELDATLSVAGLQADDTAPQLDGNATLVVPDLAPLAVFTPQLASVRGSARALVRISGTAESPQVIGEIAANELGAEVPELGITLREGTLHAARASDGSIEVKGGIASGDGRLELEGDSPDLEALRIQIRGEQFLAADIPGARVIITPDLSFTRSSERMMLEGIVRIPTARIDLQRIPQAQGGQSRSPDVVVIDEEIGEEEAGLPLHAKVTLVLGEKVQLVGFGLDARVEGSLVVVERPGEETTASGEIRASGIYKAYGQELTIEHGRLLYAGTPLTDPRLDILASRTIERDSVTVRLQVTGSAQAPELNVSSDPVMGQTEALAYLVTGRPLSQLGQGEGDSDLLQSAAQQLGGAAGGLIARSLGQRLGLDEVKVEQEESIGGAALTVGEYLSPRLFVSYGFGLFNPGQIVSLRYILTDRLSLEASQAPDDTRGAIEYRVER